MTRTRLLLNGFIWFYLSSETIARTGWKWPIKSIILSWSRNIQFRRIFSSFWSSNFRTSSFGFESIVIWSWPRLRIFLFIISVFSTHSASKRILVNSLWIKIIVSWTGSMDIVMWIRLYFRAYSYFGTIILTINIVSNYNNESTVLVQVDHAFIYYYFSMSFQF